MVLPPTDIDNQLMEDPVDDRWGRPQIDEEKPESEAVPEQMRRTSEEIGRTLDDIARGEVAGQYPAIDGIIGPNAHRPHYPNTICTPGCPNRRRRYVPDDNPYDHDPRITDVFPSVPERLYGLEMNMKNIQHEFRQHREESIRAGEKYATREKLEDLKEETVKAVVVLNTRMDRRTALVILQTAALIATTAYGVILSYKHFIQP